MFNAQPFAPGVGSSFNADSVALSSDRTSRDTVKVLNEVKSPLIQMSEFFAGIDSGIIKLVDIAKKSLGLDKESLRLESRIADIMASDLVLEEKQNLAVIDFIKSTYNTNKFIPLHEPRFLGNEHKNKAFSKSICSNSKPLGIETFFRSSLIFDLIFLINSFPLAKNTCIRANAKIRL